MSQQNAAYFRQWRAKNKEHLKQYEAQRRGQIGRTASGYNVANRESKKDEKQVRYDPLVNWGHSRGICRQAGSSFMRNHA